MHLLTAILLGLGLVSSVRAWKCGIGPFSGAVSFAIAFPADVPGINNCCIEHDALVDGLNVAREEADRVFCHCLEHNANQNWYVTSIVKPLFCTTVQLYTKWIEKQKSKDLISSYLGEYRFNRKQ